MTVVYVVLVWLMGACLVRALFPRPLVWSLHNVWTLALGGGVGIGIASALYFLTLAVAGPNLAAMASVLGVAAAAIIALGLLAKPRPTAVEWAQGPETPGRLTLLMWIAAAVGVAMFVIYSLNKPHGEWDAWSIWNLRARFLFRGGEGWRDAFSQPLAWSHPDYPLMLPGIVALAWTLARGESTLPQVLVAALFTFGAAGVLIATVGALRGKTQAFVAGVLLIGTAAFVQVGAMQYADIPLGFFMLAAVALLCLQDRYPDEPRFTLLAGFAAGFAAWTKNEGLLFALVLIAARAFALFRFGAPAKRIPGLLSLAAGMVPALAVVAFFKLKFAPPSDLLAQAKPGDILPRLLDAGRWITSLQGFVVAALKLGSFLVPVVLVLALYWYLVRFQVEERNRLPLASALGTVALMLVGDFAVYVILPRDVDWRIATSIDRILLQLWPAGLLAFFLAAAPLQLAAKSEVAEKAKPPKHAAKPQKARRAAETR